MIMAYLNIPQYPTNKGDFPQIKALDRKIVAAAVLLGLPNQEAFKLYHPEYLDANGKLNKSGSQASSHFWSYGKVKDYRESYEKELAELFGRKQTSRTVSEDIDDSRKDRALKSLLNQAMSLVEGGADLDPDTLKVCTDIFNRLGLIKSEQEQEIRPLRFLPERCFSSCRYRLFVENAVKGGDLINDCDYCRALRFAKENGFKGDDTNMLELPKEVLDAEPENTVTTLDILAGKVEN